VKKIYPFKKWLRDEKYEVNESKESDSRVFGKRGADGTYLHKKFIIDMDFLQYCDKFNINTKPHFHNICQLSGSLYRIGDLKYDEEEIKKIIQL
jgi:hypothetical protein